MDHVLYHLDGPQAIKHMDALMEIDGIDALQWTSGDAGPDGTLPDWDVIYDKAIAAGKSIWVKVYSGEFEDWIRNVDRLVKKYGFSQPLPSVPGNVHGAGSISSGLCRKELERCQRHFL